MVERRLSAAPLLLISLALAAFSAVEAYGEISPYYVAGFSAERRFLAISGDGYHAGSSLWSKEMLLRDCMEVSQSIYAKAQPTAKRTAFLAACDNESSAFTFGMPGYARAWLVKASIAAEQGRIEDFRTALAEAVRTAPNVHWLAEQRSRLAQDHLKELAPANLADYEQDLRTLLDSGEGARALAVSYVRAPQMRERLQRIVESAPTTLQARFLAEVRRLSGAQ